MTADQIEAIRERLRAASSKTHTSIAVEHLVALEDIEALLAEVDRLRALLSERRHVTCYEDWTCPHGRSAK